MLKKHETTFSFLQKFVDIISISTAWALAYLIRFEFMTGAQAGLAPLFLQILPIVILITIYFFNKNGLYKSLRFSSRYSEIFAIIKANTQSIILLVILIYFFSPDRISRLTILSYFIISKCTHILGRISIRNYLRHLRKNGKNLRHLLLVGPGIPMKAYIEGVRHFKDSGIRIKGWVDSEGQAKEFGIAEITEDVFSAYKNLRPDTIVISYPGKDDGKIESILKDLHNDITPIQILPQIGYSFIGHTIDSFSGIPVLNVNQPRLDQLDFFIKRIFDFLLCFLGLILISPLLFIIAVMVKLTSRGPIFYGQERVGLDGQNFKMWKFRSMKVAQKDATPGWTVENDPRRTIFGTLLRKTSLDELPQIWNVLTGEMSLVGPRPEQPFFVDKFRHEIPAYMLRHKMKAGITGWAQINGWRGDTSLHKRIECDLYYIKNWSLWLDVKILFLTFTKGLINKNAY